MEEEHINKKLEIIKKSLADYFNIRSSLITFSKLSYEAKGFCVEIDFKTPQNNFRTFQVITYIFLINEVNEKGFKYEKQYYAFDQMDSFLRKVSHKIETME